MRRFITLPLVVVLLGAMLLTTACSLDGSDDNGGGGDNNEDQQISSCLGNIVVQIVSALVDGEALTFGQLVSTGIVCVQAAITYFSAPADAAPSSPQVEIHPSDSDGSVSGSVTSNTVDNCTDYTNSVQFNFSVPFKVVVGPSGGQDSFNQSPDGSTDNALVAQQLFTQYNDFSSITTSGPSQSVVYDVPPHTQITFTLPIIEYYTYGEARVVHTDGSTVSLPWFFTDQYQQNGDITYQTTSC